MAFEYLNGYEVNRYNTAASNLRTQYARNKAKNVYGRGQAQLDYNLGRRDLTNQWNKYRTQIPGQLQNRGVANSGIAQQAYRDYATQRLQGFQNLDRGYQRQMGDFFQSDLDLETNLNTGLSQIEADKAARRAQLAAELKAVY